MAAGESQPPYFKSSDKIEIYTQDGDRSDDTTLEKGFQVNGDPHGEHLQDGIKRGLQARHLAMISIGGTIGTGLFLASGNSVATAGPAGALVAYAIIGLMVYCMMMSLGEMATFMPLSGSFNHYSGRFVDPALGFALGWNYFFSWAVTMASELAAAGLVIEFWTNAVHSVVWCAIGLGLLFGINALGVRGYGETEYWFSLIKVITCVVFIIVGILVDTGATGGEFIGARYWNDPYSPFNNGAVGVFSVFLVAGYSFQGTEIVGVAAGESQNPKKNVPRAIRSVFYRILLFYVLAILMIGLCIPTDDPNLLNAGNVQDVAIAPFTIVFNKAGWSIAAHIVNAVVLTSVLSAGNSSLYAASRTLCALAREGRAPSIFGRVTRWGAPLWALLASCLLGALCMLAAVFQASQVFTWLLSLTSITGYISWAGIAGTHYRFRKAYVAQGRSLEDLPYRASCYPVAPLFALTLCVVVILGGGWKSFAPFDVQAFLSSYIGIVLFAALYLGYKIVKKTKLIPLMEVDLDTGRLDVSSMAEKDIKENERWYDKLLSYVF
ncbi:uncharacterized protein VTP21DRAFT_1140 [Calcarisporiella thermophila]|uniref:uncharacterized protein n=1 Tax=Calcarisporiella thermophila TaxID=911321 RepID=UPI003743234C